MVPLGKNSAASLPSNAATRSSSRRIVGSPSRSSSPTSAAAVAARVAGGGLVTVSLRRSIVMRGNMAEATFPAPLRLRGDDGNFHYGLLAAENRFVHDDGFLLRA